MGRVLASKTWNRASTWVEQFDSPLSFPSFAGLLVIVVVLVAAVLYSCSRIYARITYHDGFAPLSLSLPPFCFFRRNATSCKARLKFLEPRRALEASVGGRRQ